MNQIIIIIIKLKMGAENEKKQLEGVMLNFGNQFMKEKENWLKKEEELNKRIDDLQMKNNNMNNQIGQYQLMIQNLLNNNLFLNNQINNMNNYQGNLINYNNNNQNYNLFKTFAFHLDNGQKCQTFVIDRCRLGDLYYIVFPQINNESYRYINDLQFIYDAKDITKHFLCNDFVGSLNWPNFSIIYVMKLKNI